MADGSGGAGSSSRHPAHRKTAEQSHLRAKNDGGAAIPAEDDEATEDEIVDMALHLGLKNIASSRQLSESQLWIVDRALEAPLPDGWQEHCDSEGRTYYYNTALQESTWDHPMDDHFREMMASASAQLQAGGSGADHRMLQEELNSALGRANRKQLSKKAAAPPSSASGSTQKRSSKATKQTNGKEEDEEQQQQEHAQLQNLLEPILSRKAQRKVATSLGLDAAGAAQVARVAEMLGINPMLEPGLLWIAEEGVDAPLPEGWRKISSGGAGAVMVAYVNDKSGTVSTEHPLFPQLRKLVQAMRQEQQRGGVGASNSSGTTSRRRQRRFSDSDGLEDSRGKSVGDRSFGDTLDSSDSWSEGDDNEEGIIAMYRGRWGSSRPGPAEPCSVRSGKVASLLGTSFSFKGGLASRLGSAVQEATGAVNTLLVRSHSSSEARRPASPLPVGVCSLGSLPTSRSTIAARESQAASSNGLGNRLRHSLSLGGSMTVGHRQSRRREDIYRVPDNCPGSHE